MIGGRNYLGKLNYLVYAYSLCGFASASAAEENGEVLYSGETNRVSRNTNSRVRYTNGYLESPIFEASKLSRKESERRLAELDTWLKAVTTEYRMDMHLQRAAFESRLKAKFDPRRALMNTGKEDLPHLSPPKDSDSIDSLAGSVGSNTNTFSVTGSVSRNRCFRFVHKSDHYKTCYDYNSIVDPNPSGTWSWSSILNGEELAYSFSRFTWSSQANLIGFRDASGHSPMKRISYTIGTANYRIKLIARSDSLLSQESSRTAGVLLASVSPLDAAVPLVELKILERNGTVMYCLTVPEQSTIPVAYSIDGLVTCDKGECLHTATIAPDTLSNPFSDIRFSSVESQREALVLSFAAPFQIDISIRRRSLGISV